MSERTFAIIKPNSLDLRLPIETALTDAGFDIIKERQIEFHPDDENLPELFGDEATSLKGGPVRVYVLEKHNAVQDLLALVGPLDPAHARDVAPESLRAIHGGLSLEDNAIYAAPDAELADIQISSIFISSPPFPPAELEDDVVDGDVLADTGLHNREQSYDSVASATASEATRIKGGAENSFRARPVPTTNSVPSIKPRMSRAAALRAGLVTVDPKAGPAKPRAPLSKEEMARTFANVPGHKRSATIAVTSTKPPSLAPRQTRASMLRTGQVDPPKAATRPRNSTVPTTSNTPGYKRDLKLNVASVAPPSIAPRQTRASALRAGQAGGTTPPKPKSRPSTAGGSSSAAGSGSASTNSKSATSKSGVERPRTEGTFVGVPGHKRSESIPVASTRTPSSAPRSNRSAELRARKLSEENAAGGAKRPSRRPSSVMLSTTSPAVSTSTTSPTTSDAKKRPAPLQTQQTRGRQGAPGDAPPPSSYRGPPRSDSPEGSSRPSRPSSVASVRRAPSIEPKTNRAALLRARAGTPVGSGRPKFVTV